MKIWEKGVETDQFVEAFTVGDDLQFDKLLAPYDVRGSIAHVKMLLKVGLLAETEAGELVSKLHELEVEVSKASFEIPASFEDIHSYIESRLIADLGETGKKVHTARSRNDQVLLDLCLFLKDEALTLKNLVRDLFMALQKQAAANQSNLMPGYTHMQAAMPSSFGMWFGAHAEALVDDLYLLHAAFQVADQNPLGSAAGYGSSMPIDRDLTTELLEFGGIKVNAMAAQMARGKLERTFGYALAGLAGTLGRLAMDLVLYMGQDFGFFALPERFTTGSSIMPHKKNPDPLELIRGHCNRIQALPTQIALLCANLPTGYHRDFQLLKDTLFPPLQSLKSCFQMAILLVPELRVNAKAIENDRYASIFSVELVNELVLSGMPFREAYQEVARRIGDGGYEDKRELSHSHLGSIGNLGLDRVQLKFDAAFSSIK